jgi:hypothetical protein
VGFALIGLLPLGLAVWCLLVALGKIESERWPYEDHPELAYWPAAFFFMMAVVMVVSAF